MTIKYITILLVNFNFKFFFIVDYHPINTSLTTNLSGDSVIINTTIKITCRAQANPPAKYQFYRNQVSLKNDTTGSDVSVITIPVSERIKQVNYSCTPFNDFGAGPMEVITVTVFCKYLYKLYSSTVPQPKGCLLWSFYLRVTLGETSVQQRTQVWWSMAKTALYKNLRRESGTVPKDVDPASSPLDFPNFLHTPWRYFELLNWSEK